MKYSIPVLVFIFLFIGTANAQNQVIDPCSVYSKAVKTKSLIPFDRALKTPDLEADQKQALRLLKAKALAALYPKQIKNGDPVIMEMVDTALVDFERAIDRKRSAGLDFSGCQIKRHLVFGKLLDYPTADKDRKVRSKFYSSNERQGIGIDPAMLYNSDLWLGAELSLFQGQVSKSIQKDANGNIIFKRERSFTADFLSIGYFKNISTEKQSLFTFNIISIKAPINIQPTQFVSLSTRDNSYFGYMPSIGFGRWNFNISYSYVIPFKQEVPLTNRHFAKLEWNYVLGDFRKKEKHMEM